MFRREVRDLIWVYFFVSFGGLLLHVRIHPPGNSMFNWIATGFAALNTFLLPFLFNSAKTVAWAYLFTWATVATGTVLMAYFSIVTWDPSKLPITVKTLILNSTLPDIIILMAKLPLAHRILRFYRPIEVTDSPRGQAQ